MTDTSKIRPAGWIHPDARDVVSQAFAVPPAPRFGRRCARRRTKGRQAA